MSFKQLNSVLRFLVRVSQDILVLIQDIFELFC